MNYEKSYNKYMKSIPFITDYENSKLLNSPYAFIPSIRNEIPIYKKYINDFDVNKYTKQFNNDININKYTKQFNNDIDINKYTKQYTNDIDINKYTNDIDVYADINKVYNNKDIPIRIPNNNGMTLIIIKNQLNGELEYEGKEEEDYLRSEHKKVSNVRKTHFTTEEALEISKKLGIDFSKEKFSVEDFRNGLNVELEHGQKDIKTNVTNDDPILTGKIALAHLNEFPDYYVRLKELEDEARAYWTLKKMI